MTGADGQFRAPAEVVMAYDVGFIGLGAIGWPMAGRVAGVFATQVWNRTQEKARRFGTEHGTAVAENVAALVRDSDVVMMCLPTSMEVREMVMAAGEGWRAGQLVIDTTSGEPRASRELAEWLAKRGVAFVDAPVSGGIAGAEAGTLTVMMGGDEAAVTRARPFVEPFAGKIVHVGPVGSGQALKAVNQALLAANIHIAGEGLAALVRLGVSAERALEVLNASSGRSNVTEHLIPKRVLTRAWPRTFRLALLEKDVGIAARLLGDADLPSGVVTALARALAEARGALGDEADHVELIREIERKAGVEIAP